MELFLLHQDLQSRNFFYKIFLTFTSESKTGFKNRKWNYFSYFLSYNQKHLLQNFSNFYQQVQNWSCKHEIELFILPEHKSKIFSRLASTSTQVEALTTITTD